MCDDTTHSYVLTLSYSINKKTVAKRFAINEVKLRISKDYGTSLSPEKFGSNFSTLAAFCSQVNG